MDISQIQAYPAILLTGIQAVGKSTFYQRHLSDTHMRINLDMLKTRRREQILLAACIEAQQPFVIDNTNITREDRARYLAAAQAAGLAVAGCYFQSRIADALRRNQQRQRTQPIPDQAITGTHRRMVPPQKDEGFADLFYIFIDSIGDFVIQEWNNAL